MEKYSRILKAQLTETEIIIYLLVNSGLSLRDLAGRLGMSATWVQKTYDSSKSKLALARKTHE